jgi:hypothetical protein
MADLVVTTDFTQVNNLNTALKSTDTIFVKAVDAVLRESNRFNRVSKVLAKTTEETLAVVQAAETLAATKIQQESLKREKARVREAAAAEREAKRIEAAAKKAADAEAKLAAEVSKNRAISAQKFTSGVNQRTGVTGASATQSGASFSAMDQEIERLRQKYDKIYSASRLYEQQLEELNRAHMLGVTSVKQHEAAIERLNVEYQQFSNAAEGAFIANNRFSQHVNQAGRGLNNFGFISQQVGYQVGDFFVQIQSGTNAFVAFGQQATQLAGLIPGIYGAIAGIGISLATAFLAYRDRASEATQETNTFQTALKSLEDQTRATKDELLALAMGYQTSAQGSVLSQIIDLEMEASRLRQEAMQEEGMIAQDRANQAIALEAEAEKLRKVLEKQRTLEEQLLTIKEGQELKAKAIKDTTETLRGVMQTISTMDLSAPFTKLLGPIQAAIDKARELAANSGGMISGPASSNINGLGNLNLPLGMVPPALGGIAPSTSQRPQRRPTDIDFGYYPDTKTGGAKRETQLRKEISLVKELTQAEKDRQTIVQSVQSSLEDGFMAMVDGTKSVTDSFKSMARDIIKELYRVLVVQRMVGGITSAFGPLTGPSTGSLGLPFGNTRASGGSIMGNTPYLVGEHGPELVIPRHSGSVVNANQTANALGGGAGNVTVQNNITVTGSDAAMVRAEVAKMIPQITNATKAAVIDAKQRGGQMAAAFR